MKKEKKETRGGARQNSGRKQGTKFRENTVVMRVPVSLVNIVKDLKEANERR